MDEKNIPTTDSSEKVSGIDVVGAENFDAVSFLRTHSEDQSQRYGFERNFYRNVLFYVARQWIKYDVGRRRWVRPNIPTWMPTPVTNKFAVSCDAMASVLDQVQPKILYAPSKDTPQDLATSDVCNSIVDVIENETEMDKVERMTKAWLAITGNAFWVSYYDNDPKYGSVFIKDLQCKVCAFVGQPNELKNGMCPQCGASDITEKQSGRSYPKGKMVTECAAPFEIYTDLSNPDLDKAPYVMRAKTYPLETIRSRWPEKGKLVKADGAKGGLGQFFYASLAYVTNAGTGDDLGLGSANSSSKQNKATVWEIFIPESRSFPKGVHAFVANGIELEKTELEYHDDEGHGFIPIIHIKWRDVPARFFGKTPADDLIYKQIQRNKLEAFIQLGIHRMSNPVWLIPQSCGVVDISGEPGEKIRYQDSNAFQSKPDRVAGVEITQSVFRWLEKIDNDIEDIASTYDVVKGDTPQNIPTLGGLELLKERGLSRFGCVIKNWENAKVKLTKHWLHIWKEYASDMRTKSVKGENSRWIIEQYSNSNLTGNVDVRAELGSSSPRSEAFQQFMVGQLLDKGLINPDDPATKIKILQKFHMADFAESLDIDVRDALQEQDEFEKKGIVRFNPEIDNNEIHLSIHIKFAKGDKFRSMPVEQQKIWIKHIKMTKEVYLQQRMMAMQMMQAQPPKKGTQSSPASPK